jgi:hypothetical protein
MRLWLPDHLDADAAHLRPVQPEHDAAVAAGHEGPCARDPPASSPTDAHLVAAGFVVAQ